MLMAGNRPFSTANRFFASDFDGIINKIERLEGTANHVDRLSVTLASAKRTTYTFRKPLR